MKRRTLIALFAIFALIQSSAFAASPWTEADGYWNKTKAKLDFGVKNLFGGWTEIVTQPYDAYQDNKTVGEGEKKKCPIKHTGIGLVNAVVYTLGGAIHTVTFFVPIDVPIPNNGVEI